MRALKIACIRKANKKNRTREILNKKLLLALKENSKRDRRNLEAFGLRELTKYIQNNLDINDLAKRIAEVKPEIKEKVDEKINSPEEAIQAATKIAKAKTYEEILSFLDMPIKKIQLGIEMNESRIRIDTIAACLAGFFSYLYGKGSIGVQILLVIFTKTIAYGFVGLTHYFFGNFDDWLNKNYGLILGNLVTLPLRAISFILKKIGRFLDQYFVNKQANQYYTRITYGSLPLYIK